MAITIEQELKYDVYDFKIWFRNGCTSNIMDEATEIFQRRSPEEQAELLDEYEGLLETIYGRRPSQATLSRTRKAFGLIKDG